MKQKQVQKISDRNALMYLVLLSLFVNLLNGVRPLHELQIILKIHEAIVTAECPLTFKFIRSMTDNSSVSHKISINMDYRSSTRIYLNFFYILGYSSYETDAKYGSKKHLKVSKYITAMVLIMFGIISLITMNALGDVPPGQRVAETIIINVFILCDIARAAFVLMQCLIFNHLLIETNNTFVSLELYFAKYLKYPITYSTFSKQYRRRMITCMGFAIFYVISYFVRCAFGHNSSIAGYLTKLMQLETAITFVHLIFYVNALHFHMQQLNLVIQRDTIVCKTGCRGMKKRMNCKEIRNRLKHYKTVHFNFYAVSQKISQYFGYSLIAICMHAFTDPIYSIFWIYQLIKIDAPFYLTWSK